MKINGKIYYSIIILIWIAMSISLASAEYKQQNSNFNITDTCTLGNGLICDNTFTCNFTITYLLDSSILINNQQANKIGVIYYITLNSSQTTNNGDYEVNINCNNGTIGGKNTKYFTISPNGEEPTISKVILYISLLFVLLVIFAVIMWAHMKDKGEVWKVWWFSIIWLWMIAVTYVSFNIARDFLTSSGFIYDFFHLIWMVLMILFPFYLLGCILFTFYFVYKQKAVKDLIERGFSTEDAQEIINERRGLGFR